VTYIATGFTGSFINFSFFFLCLTFKLSLYLSPFLHFSSYFVLLLTLFYDATSLVKLSWAVFKPGFHYDREDASVYVFCMAYFPTLLVTRLCSVEWWEDTSITNWKCFSRGEIVVLSQRLARGSEEYREESKP
jgi:hypothetical protein